MDDQHAQPRTPTDLPLGPDVVQLIARARDESVRHQHEYIGTEHLVLALSQADDVAAPLRALGIEPEQVYSLVDDTIRRGILPIAADVQRPFTSRTKQSFSFAAAVARELGRSRIEVPDLLVGLMRERLNIGAQVLADRGLTEERAFEFARVSGGSQ
jgi:ATP-dependent Clp protease ATP-binding subunit ClpC